MYIYTYIYIEREREREGERVCVCKVARPFSFKNMSQVLDLRSWNARQLS